MRLLRRQESTGAPRWLLPFLIGFIAGVLLWNMGTGNWAKESGLLDEYTLGRVSNMELNHNAFFFYVLKQRVTLLWLLAIIGSTFLGIYLLYAYVLWLGLAAGVLLSTAVIRYGVKGILLIVAGCLPQYICYVPALIIMLNLSYGLCVKLYYPAKDKNFDGSKKQMLMQYLILFAGIHLVVIIGTVFESYVNPIFVTKLLKIF